MAETLNQASTPTLQGTMPELQQALQQAAMGLPPEALQQALGMAGAFGPDLAAVQRRRETELKPSMAQAEAASKQYEQLAASAPPQVSGAQAGLNELLGSVASILSGNKTYQETASQRLQKEQQALLDSRSQNLTRLKDLYDKRAEAAKSIGNDIAEEENRVKKDRLEKSLEVINKARAQQYDMEQIRARAAEERRTQAARPTTATTDFSGVEEQVKTVPTQSGNDIKYINAGDFTPKQRTELMSHFAGTDVMVLNKDESSALTKLADVDQNLNEMFNVVKELPANYTGVAGLARSVKRQADVTLARNLRVGDPETVKLVSGLDALRSTAIQMVQAFASLGTGLRVNQAEINSVLTMDYPSANDSRSTAIERLRKLKGILGRMQSAILAGRKGQPVERPLTIQDANESNVGKTIYDPTSQRALLVVKVKAAPPGHADFKPGEVALIDLDDPNLDKKYFDMQLRGGK